MFKVFTGGVWVEQGGGGGGGTTNYSDLNNKPQINGNTLTGNKSSSQLGLQPLITALTKINADNVTDDTSTNKFVTAAQKTEWSGKLGPSDAYTKSQVDGLLGDKQDTISDLSTIRSGAEAGASALQPEDVVSTYSASGTDPVDGTAVAAALGTLDVAAQGGTGKYISQISQVDGKIVVVSTNASTAPTSGNTACITSAAVYLALQGKQPTLTFDPEPAEGSNNPVTSDGIASALAGKASSSDITAAIQALDVASVGGDAYFLTTISEVDGKIVPVAVQQSTILSDYLTVAAAASTYQTAAGMSDYYTKAQTDSAITTAIEGLDAASVGGATRYIYQISESNGKIAASSYASDTTPTEGSTKLVQSKGIKTYVDTAVANKITNDDVFGQGTRIQGTDDVHADMDDYWAQGNYYIATADNLGYIDNKPPNVLSARAKILVFQFSGTLETNNRCVQIWIPQRLPTTSVESPACFYMRYRTTSTQGEVSWTSWFMLSDGVMTAFGVANATILTGTTFNCDTATIPGVYIAGNTTTAEAVPGRPAYDNSAAKIWRLEVKSLNSARVYQEMIVFRVGTYEGDFDRYIRMKKSGTNNEWWSWKHIDTTDVGTYYPTT